jgi:spore maturation protein B
MIYIIGLYFLLTISYSIIKKNNTYLSFSTGVKDGIKIVVNMFSVLLVFSFCITCIENCGIINYLSIKYNNSGFINIILQMIIRPISNGSSYALLMSIYDKYGVNSFYGYLSTFVHSSCDTLFYIITIYSSYSKIKLNYKPFVLGIIMIIFSYSLIFIFCYYIFR